MREEDYLFSRPRTLLLKEKKRRKDRNRSVLETLWQRKFPQLVLGNQDLNLVSRFCTVTTALCTLFFQTLPVSSATLVTQAWQGSHHCFCRVHSSLTWHALSSMLKFHPNSQMSFCSSSLRETGLYFIHSFIHSLIQQIFIEILLCSHLSGSDGHPKQMKHFPIVL